MKKLLSQIVKFIRPQETAPPVVAHSRKINAIDAAPQVRCWVCNVDWHQWQLQPMRAKVVASCEVEATPANVVEAASDVSLPATEFVVFVCPECGNADLHCQQ